MSEGEQRPRATGWFVEPDEQSTPILIAIGHAVWGVAALEYGMRLELTRLLIQTAAENPLDPDPSRAQRKLDKKLGAVWRRTGGELRRDLRVLGLPPDLDERIGSAVDRRNALVHHLIEDRDVLMAAAIEEGTDAVAARIDRLALDCGELAVELVAFGMSKIERLTGKSREQLVAELMTMPLTDVQDTRERALLDMLQSLGIDPNSLFPPELRSDDATAE